MELKDFVSETLKQIISGVKDAQDYGLEHGAIVNPSNVNIRNQGPEPIIFDSSGMIFQRIEFDVAVTTTEGTQTKGGIGVFVGPVGLGSQGQSDASNSSVSRIKFCIPVGLPAIDTRTEEEREQLRKRAESMKSSSRRGWAGHA